VTGIASGGNIQCCFSYAYLAVHQGHKVDAFSFDVGPNQPSFDTWKSKRICMFFDLLSFDERYLAMSRLAGGGRLTLPISGIAYNTGVGFDRHRVDREHRFTRVGRVNVERGNATYGFIF